MMFGWGGNPHFGPFHLLSTAFIVAGFWLLAKSWPVQYEARRARRVAHTGPYARIRHPQYVGFIAIMFGFLLQWPALITVVMFPILLAVYARLARREEQDSLAEFGDAYRAYMDSTPAFMIDEKLARGSEEERRPHRHVADVEVMPASGCCHGCLPIMESVTHTAHHVQRTTRSNTMTIKKTIIAISFGVLAVPFASADSGMRWIGGEPGYHFHAMPSTKSRAEVLQELRAFRANPVGADGWRYVGGEASWEPPTQVGKAADNSLRPSLQMTEEERRRFTELYSGN